MDGASVSFVNCGGGDICSFWKVYRLEHARVLRHGCMTSNNVGRRGMESVRTGVTPVMMVVRRWPHPPTPKPGLTWEFLRSLFDPSGSERFASTAMSDLPREWDRHREQWRYVRHTLGLWKSDLLRRLLPLSTLVALECVAIAYIRDVFHLSPQTVHISQSPFALMSGVVGLLLVFRTNASFSRYWEARTALGSLVNRSRDMARLGPELLHNTPLCNALIRYTASFSYILTAHIRGNSVESDEGVQRLLTDQEINYLSRANHKVDALIELMTAAINCKDIEPNQQVRIDTFVSAFLDILGTCERIIRTPIPLSYTRHTSRVCLLWTTCMPFVLSNEMGDAMLLAASVIICVVLNGIEDIGVQIEEPFRILPMDELNATIEANVMEFQRLRNEAWDICQQYHEIEGEKTSST